MYTSSPLIKFPQYGTITIPKKLFWFDDEKDEKLFNNAIDTLNNTQANISYLDFEPLLELARLLYEGPWVAERSLAIRDFFEGNSPKEFLDPTVMSIIEIARSYDATDAFAFEYNGIFILN